MQRDRIPEEENTRTTPSSSTPKEGELIKNIIRNSENTMEKARSSSVGRLLLKLKATYFSKPSSDIDKGYQIALKNLYTLAKGDDSKIASLDEFQKKAEEALDQWDTATLYSPESKKSEGRVFRLKEVFTLVWTALMHDEAFIHAYKGSDKKRLQHAIDDRVPHRIHSLFNSLQKIKNEKNNCHTGARHDLASVLNQIYEFPETHELVDLIEDANGTVLTLLKEKVHDTFWAVHKDASKADQQTLERALIDWMSTSNPYPLLKLISSQLPEQAALSGETLYAYVAAHFEKHGTDPKDIELETRVSDYLFCLEYAFDKDKDPLVFLKISKILNALPGKEATEQTALKKVQRWIEKSFRSTQTEDCKKIRAFHKIHTLYQETLQMRLLFILAGKEDEMKTFLDASQAYFEAINDSESDPLPDVPQALKQILDGGWINKQEGEVELKVVEPYKEILKACKKDRMQAPIENFFADWFTARNADDLTSVQHLYASLLDASFQKKIVLTDQEIARFIESQQSRSSNENEVEIESQRPIDNGELNVNPYWINRVLLHAIIVPPKDWSLLFAEAFREVRVFIKNHFNPEEMTSALEEMTASALEESSYPWQLQEQLAYLGECYVAHQKGSGMPERPTYRIIVLPHDVKTAKDWEFVAYLLEQNPEKFKAVYRPIRLYILQILSEVVGRTPISLSEVLALIPDEADQCTFALKDQDNIWYGEDLVAVLELLPETVRWAVAQKHLDKIQDTFRMISVLKALPESVHWAFVTACKDKIGNGTILSFMLEMLSKTERLEFAMVCKDKIENGYDLTDVLNSLPKTVCLEFAIACKDKIKDGNGLDLVINFFTKKEERQELITAWEAYIKQKRAEVRVAKTEVCPERTTVVQTPQSIFSTSTPQQHEPSGPEGNTPSFP